LKPQKIAIKEVIITHTSQKNHIQNYIWHDKGLDTQDITRTTQRVSLASIYVTLISLIGDTVLSLSYKFHYIFGMAAESYNKKGASNRTLLLTRLQKSKRGFLWVTLGFFLVSLAAHWVFAWSTYVQEQQAHNQPIQTGDYLNMTIRDIMENWQSEFLQLMWQVAGLSFLLYVGSPQSKESSERIEQKVDLIIKKIQERNLEQAEKEQIAR
jgi:hypothetical protein